MKLIDLDTLMPELEREVEMADDWKTAHEIVNIVKYAPVVNKTTTTIDEKKLKVFVEVKALEYYALKTNYKSKKEELIAKIKQIESGDDFFEDYIYKDAVDMKVELKSMLECKRFLSQLCNILGEEYLNIYENAIGEE